jgi:hypothetical protein
MEASAAPADPTAAALRQQLADAEAREAAEDAAESINAPAGGAAAAAVAPGDGTQASQGQPAATAEGTGAIAAADPAATEQAAPEPTVLELLAQHHQAADEPTSPHAFIDNLRSVTTELDGEGRILEGDLVSSTEQGKLTAVLVKLVGELAGKAS